MDRLGNETDQLEILNDNLREATIDLNETVTFLSGKEIKLTDIAITERSKI